MKNVKVRYLAMLVIAVLLSGCANRQQAAFDEAAAKAHRAVTPVPQTAPWATSWWMPRHEANVARIAEGNIDLMWIGDSITHGWEDGGLAYWNRYYAPRNAINMGFSADQTQHVLWRLDHIDFSTISPKLTIIMIGTNNSNGNDFTSQEIADGIIAICGRLRTEMPGMKILLLAIFPRGEGPSPQRDKNAEASSIAAQIADGKTIFYMNINDEFLEDDGTLPREIMPDLLHPNEEGYRIWAEAIEPTVARLMGE